MTQRYLSFPLRFAHNGRIANSAIDSHIKELIEQLIFTNPSERVNLPEFGCGLMSIIFEGNNESLASNVKFKVTAALNRWLGDLINVENVLTERENSEIKIKVVYSRRDTLIQDSSTVSVRIT